MSRIFTVVALGIIIGAALVPGATAYALCEIGPPYPSGTFQAGAWRVPGGAVGGMYSSIFNYPNPGVAVTEESGQFVRIKSGGLGWAQIGWMEWVDHLYNVRRATRYTYSRVGNGTAGVGVNIFPAQPINQSSYYTVLHNRLNPGTVTFQLNGVNVTSPITGFQWLAARGEALGATNNLSAQMPGGYQVQSHFFDTRIWYGTGWQALNGTKTFNPSYHYAYGGEANYYIMDLRCP